MSTLQNNTEVQDEIELLELLQVLWKKKGLILLIFLLTVVASIGYLFFHTPVYEAKITLGPPIAFDLKAFNFRSDPVESLNGNDAYTTFRMTLFSEATLRAFKKLRDQDPTLAPEEKAVSIMLRPETMGRYLVLAQGSNPTIAAKQATAFVSYAHKIALNEVNAAQMREVAATKLFLEKKIKLVQEQEQKKRKEQLVQLQNALRVAEASNLEYPSAKMTDANATDHAYLRGSNALKAEIDNLENHPNILDNPELVYLGEQYDELNNIEDINDNVILAKSYGNVVVSDNPSGLDTKRFIMFSCFAGLFFGVMMVILLHIRQHIKKSGNELERRTTL